MKLLVNARVRSFNYRVCRLGMIASVMLVLLFLVLTALLGALPTAAGDDMTASATKQNVLVEQQPIDIPELDLPPAPESRPKTPVKQVGDKKTETGTTDRETDKETLKPAKEKETEQQYTYKKPAIPAAKEPAPIADTKTSSTPPAKAPPKLKKPFSKEFETDLKAKRDAVRGAFQHAWKGYKTFAWGEDELLPLSKKGRVWFNLGLTIIDALDTAWIMGEKSIFKEARDWVGTSYSLKQSTTASVFETTIRVLGGLLSTYALTEDKLFLKRATEVGDTLLKAFESKSGIPYMNFDFAHQQAQGFSTSLADCGTLSLEFKYLSHVTGDEKYWNAVQKISKTLFESPNTNGLLYTWANVKPFGFIDQRISIGSGGDSYYEYLFKQYHQTSGKEPIFETKWNEVVDGIRKHLLGVSQKDHFIFVGELTGGIGSSLSQSMEHLSCFFPGTLALSATGGKRASEINMTPRQLRDLDLAEEITRSCYETYKRVRTGLGPERVYWSSLPSQAGDTEGRAALKVLKDHQSPIGGSSTPASYETYEGTHSRHPDVSTLFDGTDSTKLDFDIQDSRNMLRPETIESLFILYRITGKQEYRDMGWEIFQAFERWTKVTTGGYTELSDVNRIPPPQGDKMETFFLGETLKYFYLLFSDESVVPLDKYVFNTEAHPLPRFNVDPKLEGKLLWLP